MLSEEGYITAAQGKGYFVNSQDSELLKEQHLRKVESSLNDAIVNADIAGITDKELIGMLNMLLSMKEE